MDILQDLSIEFNNMIKKNLGKIKKLSPAKQRELGKLLSMFKDGLDTLSEGTYESVNEAMSNKAPKMYIKYAAVVKKVRELEDKQKELAQPYFDARSKGDSVKEKSQLELMKKNQAELNSYRRNLKNIEDKYINAMDYFPGE